MMQHQANLRWLALFLRALSLLALLISCAPWRTNALAAPVAPPPRTTLQRLMPTDLAYRGVFVYPPGDEWTYSGHALAYFPAGDDAGPTDGYPGSLFAVGHAWEQRVGEIAIPAPLLTADLTAAPVATILQPLGDVTGGWLNNCTFDEGCEYREVAGLEYLPNVDKLAWNLRDWYNVDGGDQDSLGWSDRNLSNAQGVWHIGPRGDASFHNAKTSNYLLTAPLAFADQHLGGQWLLAGNARPAGALGGSQGPTLYATAPWLAAAPLLPGQELEALALLYYPEVAGCLDQPERCHFPAYRAADDWGGAAWIETADHQAVLFFGRKGLGPSCYGIPGAECQASLCTSDKGWHADPYEPQILFYDPTELAAVASGERTPWSVQPYAIHRPLAELLRPECALLSAVAYDAEHQLIYATESQAGPGGETVVHVWAIAVADDPATPALYLPLVAS